MKPARTITAIGGAAALAVALAACNSDGTNTSQTQDAAQKVTQQAAKQMGVPSDYPLSQMHGMTDEQANDRERLLRLNNPDKLGYVYLLTASGQVLAYYAIKGKVSSTSSQMLNSQDTTKCDGSNNSTCSVVDSIGDDGTFGGEEGGQYGIFFFTTAGVMVESADPYWVYADAPLHLSQPPLLTLPLSEKPSTTAGQLTRH